MTDNQYLQLLPNSLTHSDGELNQDLAQFLKIFETILTAKDDEIPPNIPVRVTSFGQVIDDVQRYSDPSCIPRAKFDDFAPWMGRCLGVVVQQDWSYYQLKQMIEQILPIYRIRTTVSGMEALFAILTGYPAQVVEVLGSFGIGFYRKPIEQSDGAPCHLQFCSGRIGTVPGQDKRSNMVLGGKMLGGFFVINLTVAMNGNITERDLSLYQLVRNLVEWLNEEKPVQTQYQLNYTTTPMQVGARGSCTVGINSTLVTDKVTRTFNSWQDLTPTLKAQLLGGMKTVPDSSKSPSSESTSADQDDLSPPTRKP